MTERASSDTYPIVRFIARHGHLLSLIVGLGVLLVGVLAAVEGAPFWVSLAFAGGAFIAYVLLRSYGELASILLDILLPQ